mmetsp:Transcript_68061/g.192840  ORF Transcript_68061/g.192840 Transcript_68061/m.192840 type:complete len:270 (+) Transcript_68061:147-956(+)
MAPDPGLPLADMLRLLLPQFMAAHLAVAQVMCTLISAPYASQSSAPPSASTSPSSCSSHAGGTPPRAAAAAPVPISIFDHLFGELAPDFPERNHVHDDFLFEPQPYMDDLEKEWPAPSAAPRRPAGLRPPRAARRPPGKRAYPMHLSHFLADPNDAVPYVDELLSSSSGTGSVQLADASCLCTENDIKRHFDDLAKHVSNLEVQHAFAQKLLSSDPDFAAAAEHMHQDAVDWAFTVRKRFLQRVFFAWVSYSPNISVLNSAAVRSIRWV